MTAQDEVNHDIFKKKMIEMATSPEKHDEDVYKVARVDNLLGAKSPKQTADEERGGKTVKVS